MKQTLDNVFGFAFKQPLYKTLAQMRVLQVSWVVVAAHLCVDAWYYMKDYAMTYPDAPWLVSVMPVFIGANVAGLWAAISEARKSHSQGGD